MRTSILFVAALATGCANEGLSVNHANAPLTGPCGVQACSITLAGALSSTYDCAASAHLGWDSDKDVYVLNPGTPAAFGSGADASILFYVSEAGRPVATTVTLGETAASTSTVFVGRGNYALWSFEHQSGPRYGAANLALSCVTSTGSDAKGERYAASGTITATLDPVPGTDATDTVEATATFTLVGDP